MQRRKPLEGVVVVAIEQAVAAPFCTSRLADAGATVIKIERPEGDLARGYDTVAAGQSSYFVWLNRGKKSVVLDLTTAEGKSALSDLLAGADVLVQNLKPGALAKLGFDPAKLCHDRPSLICCSISGYGETGPYSSRKAYDLLIQAETGLASITGGEDGPARVGISVVDIATGATAHAAILEALLARGRDGRGCNIQISMFDVMADWLSVPLLHARNGTPPRRVGLAHPSIAPYGVFKTADGRSLLIAIQNDREWSSLCKLVLRKPELTHDPALATNVDRVRNRATTDRIVDQCLSSLTRDTAVERLLDADIAFADLNDLTDLVAHPALSTTSVRTPNGPIDLPLPAPVVDGKRPELGDVPALGADTQANLPAA
jgi:formyl-CoA transferase